MNINILEFSGINNVITPFKLNKNLGTEFKNIDTSSYTLKSSKQHSTVGSSHDSYYYKYPSWEKWSNKPLSVNYLNGSVFYTSTGVDSSSTLKRWFNNTEYVVGMNSPTNEINVSESGDWYRSEDFYYAYYYYAVTYYNEVTGEESPPKLSTVFGARKTTRTITLDTTDAPTYATHTRLYRVGGFNNKFSLVMTSPIAATLNAVDEKPDTALTTLLTTSDTIVPPVGLCNLTDHNGRFYASIGSRLRFSDFGNASAWETLSFIDFESDITGLASINGMLLIFLETKVFALSGSSIKNYVLLTLTGDIGCKFPMSISYIRNLVIWYTYNGIVCSDGNDVSFMTDTIYNFDDNLVVLDSAVFGDKYYMLTNDILFELDMSKEVSTFRLYETPTDSKSLTVFEREFWIITNSSMYKVFGGSGYSTLTYKTKKFTGPLYLLTNEVKSVIIRYKGTFMASIYDDNNIEVASFGFSSDLIELKEFFIKVNSNILTSIELRIEGVGEIFAIGIETTSTQAYKYEENS